jgi:two-component system cell cycle response regulator
MSGRILIVDGVATNRILLRAMLIAAHHEVEITSSPAEAALCIAARRPDLVLLDICQDPEAALALCARLKADATDPPIPVIATLSGQRYCQNAPTRIQALRAGADEVIDKSAPDTLLQARIRSLLRARDAAAELALDEDCETPPGFAEGVAGFERPGTVAVVAPGGIAGPRALGMLLHRLPQPPRMFDPAADMSDEALAPVPDLFIIDGAGTAYAGPDQFTSADVFRIVSDLRSRSVSRYAAILVLLPRSQPEMAALALDLGAADVVDETVTADELAHRVRHIIAQKTIADRRRDQMQSRLLDAITDPLTGLHNRRYAVPRLERMIWAAEGSGRPFAVMMLDIDHFKRINDTHGHAAGDSILIEVARRLRDNLRAIDLIARFGGEEFLVAMPDTTLEQARGAAERLRRVIEGSPFATSGARLEGAQAGPGPATATATGGAQPLRLGQPGRIGVTLSIGVAVNQPGTDDGMSGDAAIARLLGQADTALYAAKNAGRNQVTVSCNAA